ncbi:hypothetical protein [Actinocrinis sp.]|uniref:hypothetical protein n=1 Tax=Actinocrinis sp. TaxID=1920516 RepID=UPI002D459F92|nr:hypothetical protein [Actinocrinis sp.]HZP53536.1 hypothetical protein [Actinocrinis sp.]
MSRPRSRDPRLDTAWLSGALREQADEHEADLSRIEARFERLTVDDSRRAKGRRLSRPLRLRLIGVPLGALAAVATATIAVGVTLGIRERPAHPVSQVAVSPSSNRSAAGQLPPSTPTLRPAGTASPRSESSPTSAPPAGPVTAVATLDSHSNQYWTQENLTVTVTHAVKALHVVVTVSGGATVKSTGSWTTLLAPQVDSAVSQTPTGLQYDFALKPGQTLQPATYVFGFQFNRPAGHAFALDAYTVTATTVDGTGPASASGNFAG